MNTTNNGGSHGHSHSQHGTSSGGKCPFGHGSAKVESKVEGVETPAVPLSEQLKAATKDLHTKAETHPAQVRLVTGLATKADYGAWLAQMWRVHAALDAAVLRLKPGSAHLGALIHDYHFRTERAATDLAFIGYPQDFANAGAGAFIAKLNAAGVADVPWLVGVLYVLEGSTNGGRFIARAIQKGLGTKPGEADRYLSPHGEEQGTRWNAFKRGLDELTLSSDERHDVIRGAGETFAAVTALMEDLEVARV